MSLAKIQCFRRIVTPPRSDRVTRVSRGDLYLPELSISGRVRGVITETVLTAQFLCNLLEDLFKCVLAAHHECGAAGLRRKFSECIDIAAAEAAASTPAERENAVAHAIRDRIDD